MPAPRLRVFAALAAVCLIWGSTYWAIRVALDGFAPFTIGAARFLVAGTVLYAWSRARGCPAPTPKQWAASTLVGVLLLAVSNGGITFGEQRVSSSVASVVVATMPLWTVLFGRAFGDRPSRAEMVSLALGFAGVALLHAGGDFFGNGAATALMLIAPAAWALGSVWSRRLPLPADGAMASAAQMLTGGAAMAIVATATGERLPSAPPVGSVLALLYLIVFGSLVAFSAYGFLLRHTRPAIATSYAYVNPLVALVLGVTLGGEELHAPTVAGALVILAAVALLKRNAARPALRTRAATVPTPVPTSR